MAWSTVTAHAQGKIRNGLDISQVWLTKKWAPFQKLKALRKFKPINTSDNSTWTSVCTTFAHFTTFPDYFRKRLPKIPEDCQRFSKTNEEVRPLPKMSEEPSKHLIVFSSETVNIEKLANLTANTKNYGQITLNTKPHSDPHDKIKKIVKKHVWNQYYTRPKGVNRFHVCL